MNRLLAFLAAMLVVWPAMAQTQSTGIGRTIGKKSAAGYVVAINSTMAAGNYVIGEAFPKSMVGFERGSAFVGTLYACETPTYAAATCTAHTGTLNIDRENGSFDTTRGWYVLTITTPETGTNISYLRIYGGYELGGGGGGVDASALENSYMTSATMTYLSSLKSFEGLDPNIPWTRYWIDPYAGLDTNPGTYDQPFRTLGKWKELASFGVWVTIKNGGRDRPMYISNQTFPYPSAETCVVGETVTYTGGTSRILDIDIKAGKIVFETLTGNPIVASDVITTATQSGSGCAWTVGARTPAIWDGTLALCALDNTDPCSIGDRYTTTGCAGGGANVCWSAIESYINLSSTPESYNHRIVTIIDAEDPDNPPIVHADKETLGDLNNTQAGTNRDPGGLFIAGNSGSHGCLGVANIWADAVMDDVISQHQEGCVRALNVRADRVWNLSNAKNNNVVTTHGGSAGLGGVVSVNGGGVSYRFDDTAGPTIAPADSSYLVLIGRGLYSADMTNWAAATTSSVFGGIGGRNTIIGHEVSCTGTGGATLGCVGASLTSSSAAAELNSIGTVWRFDKNVNLAAVSLTSSGNAITARLWRPSFTGGRAVQTFASSGAINLDVKGAIFDGLDMYINDLSTYAGASTTTTGVVNGVYDNDGSARWTTGASGATTFTTAAAAEAGMPTWDIHVGEFSRQTDVTEYTADFGRRCSSLGQCWNTYNETFSLDFPILIYDYLPVPIRGYIESGLRNYGAR